MFLILLSIPRGARIRSASCSVDSSMKPVWLLVHLLVVVYEDRSGSELTHEQVRSRPTPFCHGSNQTWFKVGQVRRIRL